MAEDQPKTSEAPVESETRLPPEAVFVGARLNWEKRVDDLRLNSDVAEQWEESFADWSIDGRSVQLRAPAESYRVRLEDGRAYFAVETPSGLGVAISHLQDFLERLQRGGRREIHLALQVDFLREVEMEFDELRDVLADRILNRDAFDSLDVSLADFNYLVDVTQDGRWFQLNIGPVRAYEIPRRVGAASLERIPDVAIYYQAVSKSSISEDIDVQGHLDRVLQLGSSTAEELLP